MRTDIVRTYKDIHSWVGIVSGLMLFIAFYAGSVTMFEKPLERWATPPSALSPAPSLQQADALVAAVLAEHPKAASRYFVSVRPHADQPAREAFSHASAVSCADFSSFSFCQSPKPSQLHVLARLAYISASERRSAIC